MSINMFITVESDEAPRHQRQDRLRIHYSGVLSLPEQSPYIIYLLFQTPQSQLALGMRW